MLPAGSPAEVTCTQLSSGLHSPSWTETQGTGPAPTRPGDFSGGHAVREDAPEPGVTGPAERRETVLRPEPDPDHEGTP
ncbi:hypothetical protein ACWD6R_33280 [Streptomyces sp. NPDC005151]